MISILVVLFSIIALLVIHEFGHFIIAKKFGLKVEEFGVGYPPRLFGKQIGDTFYSVNLIPFGAFVKIPGEIGEASGVESGKQFSAKPIWQRALIVFGGVASFWVVAAILLSFVFIGGVNQAISDDEPANNAQVQVLAISSGSPAEIAGILPGDVIKQISISNFQLPIDKISDVQGYSEEYKGEEIALTIQRMDETLETKLTPRVFPPEGEGPIGVALVRTVVKTYPLWQAPIKGIEATGNLTVAIINGWVDIIGSLFLGEGMPSGVQFVGPIGIGSLLTKAFNVGVTYFLQLIAMIAVYLAIFNLLPIPALDGGKLVFLAIEKIKGSPVNIKIEQNLTAICFICLLAIMAFVTIKDIIRLF